MDFEDKSIHDKYQDKIIFDYDIKSFRNDGYSKEINILQADFDNRNRIIQALLVSQYRQDIASDHGLYLKPVILFKAQKLIAESHANKALFESIIDSLQSEDFGEIQSKSQNNLITKIFDYYTAKDPNLSHLVQTIKTEFGVGKVKITNTQKNTAKEKESLDDDLVKLLNSLEDKTNKVRAIFTVNKLNEGWDVLNLFDIVRLYETRDAKNNKPGNTTISEAQLIGRGARYFPFDYEDSDRFKRKFDSDLNNELRILEELYYHSHNDSRYISEINQALRDQGWKDNDENRVERTIEIKESHKNA